MMSKTLDEHLVTRDNNFNIIRFLAACLVLFSHSYDLFGLKEPLGLMLGHTFGSVAVDIFFITSGLLIARSFYTRNDLKAFAKARVLRIYPALIVAVFFTVFVLGVWLTTVPLSEYFTDELTRKYLVRNSVLFLNVKYFLPGVFENVPYKLTVNGSLWTLPYEVKSYVFLVIFACLVRKLVTKLKKDVTRLVYTACTVPLAIAAIVNHYVGFSETSGYQLYGMFFVGATYYLWRDKISISWRGLAIALGLITVGVFYKPAFFAAYFLCLPYAVLGLAFLPKGKIRLFNKVGDYSYGVYIYAFPIQQSLLSVFPQIDFAVFVSSAMAITLVFAVASWHGIEKRCLKLGRKKAQSA